MPVYAYVAPLEQATKITALRQVRLTLDTINHILHTVLFTGNILSQTQQYVGLCLLSATVLHTHHYVL
jgi:hypothetical protein